MFVYCCFFNIILCNIIKNLLQELKTLKHRVDELEQEKMQYEQKLKVTQVLPHKHDSYVLCPVWGTGSNLSC